MLGRILGEGPGQNRLLHHRAVVARVEPEQDAAEGARLLDQRLELGAAELGAGGEPQHGTLDALVDQVVLQRPLVLEVEGAPAALGFVERRLGDVEVPALDDLRHLPEEKGQQQRADMRAVHVRIGHDDDAVVAQLVRVEALAVGRGAADAGAERGDQRADLGRGQHPVGAHALDVEDFSAQGQDGLEGAVAALLGRTAGGIALHQQDLALRRIALLTVGELAGQRGDVERALAGDGLAGLACRLAGGRRQNHLGHHRPGLGRVFLQPGRETLVEDVLDRRADLGGDELVLRLRGEFRVRDLDGDDGGQALAAIVAGERDLLLLGDPRGLGVAGHLARQGGAEARHVGAAVALRDVVGERQDRLVERVVPPERRLDADAIALAEHGHRLGHAVDGFAGAVEIAHERLDAALVAELLPPVLGMARVGQHDAHARVQEGELPQALLQRREVELRHREGFGARQERHLGAAAVARRADDLERGHRVAVMELHPVFLAAAPDPQLQAHRQRVDDRDADAVQATRDLVGVLVELTAGMELGHDDLGGRDPLLLVDVGGNAAAVVGDRAGAVGVQRHRHEVGVAGKRLVDGVVHHLVDHVVQAGAVVGIADIHAGPLAHGIQALQHADRFRAVAVGVFGVGGVSHEIPRAGGS
ncbi:hypothetical protein CHKEEEPN_4430 [Methylorubrum podarium]|nr:hypothetical protein CHKEEEPN_4430 [Methylorubrum podarium]